ncbi:glycosyltransferase family 2 protein, partial [Candidatus Falkowbacteria bacterium]|nr:glycosyltransferase family 2 protein [Candidatus Falkowbacteria bacterium]
KLENCLNSIYGADLSFLNYEVIVVENASGDELFDLQEKYNFNLMISNKNLGMGEGNNLGIKEARAQHILILNPDTVINSEAFKILFERLSSEADIGLIGPKLVYPDGSLQSSCSRFPIFFVPILRRTFLGEFFKKTRDIFMMTDFDHKTTREVDWLMGSCLMLKKSWALENGEIYQPMFDSRYFMYFEDIDLCREIKKHGKKIVYEPRAVVIHDHARDSAKNPWYIALFKDKITWVHIFSWLKYFMKWGFRS